MPLAAVAQLTSSASIAANLSAAQSLLKRAASAGARAVFLPEACDFIAPAADVPALAASAEARSFVAEVAKAAKEHGVWVSMGVHEMGEEKRCWNTNVLVDAQGEVRERYRKLHLFDVDIAGGLKILESGTTIPGKQLPAAVPSPLGQIGLQTCYDVRFPEAALALRRQGAEILTYPSAFTVRTGAAHWELLLRARAVDTQCWVLAAAQVGAHPGSKRVSYGHAMIVDPWGSVVAQCPDTQPYEPTFCVADIDLTHLSKLRAEMPLWEQRRTDVYAEL
ncbi:putative NIT2-nitrilase [Tilletiopsis washingtonensis]|uniref:Putative NIT2-nitrilase n=1 Tax=Tilletiopsis washingtonensis TaxID=58919 RepID=A0A316YYX4_9BASI|nr:putative NIT2-nitrilase [Tilletiopsis washingtonensis]PWN94667.1 putative NIT2-nitrilase [Tilletiopsis washingtonensis]